MKIAHTELIAVMHARLLYKGFAQEKARECAQLFAQASLDGVSSHGVNRFVLFTEQIDSGIVNGGAEPVRAKSHRALEQWDGNAGSGLNNASFAMRRALELAKESGIGCVALRNTNHWMRGGNYGLIAAEAGMLGICWSNTMPNMPVWGGAEARIGNNPVIFAVPRKPYPVLLDMSMSLFSYGKLETYRRSGDTTPFDCGFDREGNLTRDPREVLESQLPLSIGYWKGAGLSILLDLFASVLSEGSSTCRIGELPAETSLSQIFIAIDPGEMLSAEAMQNIASETLAYVVGSKKMQDTSEVRYPGQRSFQTRERQLRDGVEVDDSVWESILRLPS